MSNYQVEPANKPQALTTEALKAVRHEQVQGISRRELLRGSLAAGMGLWLLEVTAGTIGFLWPNLEGKGMEIEMRRVDMREVYPDVNAIAPAPRGETLYRGPAKFETTSPLAERFDATLTPGEGIVTLIIRYGDRRLALPFVR